MIDFQPASPSNHAPAEERVFEGLFHDSPLPLVVTSLVRDMVLAVNTRAIEVFREMGVDVVGGPVTAFYTDPTERESVLRALLETGHINDRKLRLQRRDGSNVWVLLSSRRVTWNGESAALGAFVDLTPQLEAEQALAASEHRLAEQSRTLTELTERSASATEHFNTRLCDILRVAAETLQAERVSLWRLDAGHASIRCVSLFKRTPGQYESGARIERADCVPYFEALETERVIAAHDAHRDRRTICFRDGYLVPHGIGAMLDVPLRQRHGTLGVLCTEHVGGARTWALDEQNFAVSVGNLIAVAMADEELRGALDRLAASEARAHTILETAHDAFIGIDAGGLIVSWNAQAAATFGWARDEALGRNLADTIIPPGFRTAHLEGLRRFHETGDAPVLNQRLELSGLHRSGREFPIELTITSPIHGENGLFFGAFLRDISSRREHDEQLQSAKDSAERSRDRLDRELASAGLMQQLLLPSELPTHPRVQFASYYRTSRHAGGDYYDVRPLDADRFALVVADVSGHGASAAIVMAMVRAVLHADDAPHDPEALLHHLNRHFRYLWTTAMFATAVVAVIDVARRTLRLASAGHPPPLLMRGGQVSPLPVTNAPLLFWEEFDHIPVLDTQLAPGDRLVFYTDGITDRQAADDSLFEMAHLTSTLADAAHLEIDAMLRHLVEQLDAFGGDTEPDDDQTVLTIGVR